MDVTADLTAPCSPDELFAWVATLDRYPRWLDIVARAQLVTESAGNGEPAWAVDLRGRLGPLARSKRLRMVRTVHEPPRIARFERVEHDSRRHSAWVLEATVARRAPGSCLTMRLHYGGSLWGPVLERMLGDEIEVSRTRLLACIAGSAP